jgi:uncharacterized protein (TIGR00288 family)
MEIQINQEVAILVDGNNIERGIASKFGDNAMLNYDTFIEKILRKRTLNRFIYLREGDKDSVSKKFIERLKRKFFGIVVPCKKSVDVPLTIHAVQLAEKVDTIIIFSGDADFIDLVEHLKSKGVRVEVASISGSTSPALKEICDTHSFISEEDCYYFNDTKETNFNS